MGGGVEWVQRFWIVVFVAPVGEVGVAFLLHGPGFRKELSEAASEAPPVGMITDVTIKMLLIQ